MCSFYLYVVICNNLIDLMQIKLSAIFIALHEFIDKRIILNKKYVGLLHLKAQFIA